jgi:hypothetical protein
LSSNWEALIKQHSGKKVAALAEFGGVPDIDKMKVYGVRWSFFTSWSSKYGPRKLKTTDLKRIYTSPLVINKEDLPASLRPSSSK